MKTPRVCQNRASALMLAAASALLLSACSGGEPTPGGSCTTSRDCVITESCVGGTCTPKGSSTKGCSADKDCMTGEWCDIVTRTCKALGNNNNSGDAGTSTTTGDAGMMSGDTGTTMDMDAGSADAFEGICAMDSDCGSPPVDICLAMQCVKGCGQPNGLQCTGGTVCNMQTGHCEQPMNSCSQDSDCNPPTEICINNTCEYGCGLNPGLCGQGELCDTSTGRCVMAPMRCMMDSDCMPPMTVCEGVQCVPGCAETGGIQCTGATPFCNNMTGRCQATSGMTCNLDSDCMMNQICENNSCIPRCDAPGGGCTSPQVCDSMTGRCIMGGLNLGDTCTQNAQCTTDVCLGLTINMSVVRTCSRPCGATSDCPRDFTCADLGGMSFCVSERVFTPTATFDTPSGGSCTSSSNTCQSRWCNPSAMSCLETCSRDSHCSRFGGQCWMYEEAAMGSTPATFQLLCIQQSGSSPGASCTQNSNCRSGICSRYTNSCAQPCCSDSDCASNQNCSVYDLDTANIVKVCTPASGGSGAFGATCTMASDCQSETCIPTDPSQMNSPRQCSTLCCTDADCSVLPRGGTCQAFNGPVMGSLIGACVPN